MSNAEEMEKTKKLLPKINIEPEYLSKLNLTFLRLESGSLALILLMKENSDKIHIQDSKIIIKKTERLLLTKIQRIIEFLCNTRPRWEYNSLDATYYLEFDQFNKEIQYFLS